MSVNQAALCQQTADDLIDTLQVADRQHDLPAAWQAAKEFLRQYPSHDPAFQIAYLLPGWAVTWEQFQQANEEFIHAYPSTPSATVALISTAQGLTVQNRFTDLVQWLNPFIDQAVFDWSVLSAIDEQRLEFNIQVRLWHAKALAASRQISRALADLDELEKLSRFMPNQWHSRPELIEEVGILRANCYLKTNQPESAMRLLEKIFRLSPAKKRPAALWAYAASARALGQAQEFQNTLEQITSQFPQSPEAAMARFAQVQQPAHHPQP